VRLEEMDVMSVHFLRSTLLNELLKRFSHDSVRGSFSFESLRSKSTFREET
jgi:hypothetical protein